MIWNELTSTIKTAHFYTYQLARLFPNETSSQVNMQLWRWCSQGKIMRLKQGLYVFSSISLDEFSISQLLYQPSYVTAESVLNAHGMIPDIPLCTIAVTPRTTKLYENQYGRFQYHKLKKELFFGYRVEQDNNELNSYQVAYPEKALLDFIYLRKKSDLSDIRVAISLFNNRRLQDYAQNFPNWVRGAVDSIIK